ncbi:MAG: insulinase family protein [Planctomycetes bacterium]|nr:insulinase family protein [Planctomycetota bacterium]MBL7146067.1 insulinase family protein [Phycisphaerae bacterium]
MTEKFDEYVLKNGMVLLGEKMEAVASVAFDFMLPAGAALLPDGCCGAGGVIAEWIFRGAGDRNSRQLGDALDGLGLARSRSVGSSHITVGAALEAGNLAQTLDLYADIILKPSLEDDQFELARQLAIDGVLSLDDEPRHKVMLKLREKFYPSPLGRSSVGDIAELKALTTEKTKQIIKDNFNLSQTIFAVAGKYDFDAVCQQIERLFKTERQENAGQVKIGSKAGKYTHLDNDGAQVHIGLMTGTVKATDEDYYNARVAVSVLSGGMSARLFTKVREERGLCYAIGARYHSLKEAAGIMCYAGTTPDKAQETLDVIIQQFNELGDGISEEEIQRAKVGLQSSLILSSESSSSRAGSIAGDYYMLGRVRSLDEIKEKIEETSVDSVLGFLRSNKFKDFTVVTIGPKQVTVK